ncbi:hypothetical protein Fmac_001183 [Flemingia macrophylla]|uniref:Uncharacterized protein n=1 Tax=Flemingia macrophylla TaxID=520843 RepID=A0ABD1NH27_9FABA
MLQAAIEASKMKGSEEVLQGSKLVFSIGTTATRTRHVSSPSIARVAKSLMLECEAENRRLNSLVCASYDSWLLYIVASVGFMQELGSALAVATIEGHCLVEGHYHFRCKGRHHTRVCSFSRLVVAQGSSSFRGSLFRKGRRRNTVDLTPEVKIVDRALAVVVRPHWARVSLKVITHFVVSQGLLSLKVRRHCVGLLRAYLCPSRVTEETPSVGIQCVAQCVIEYMTQKVQESNALPGAEPGIQI